MTKVETNCRRPRRRPTVKLVPPIRVSTTPWAKSESST